MVLHSVSVLFFFMSLQHCHWLIRDFLGAGQNPKKALPTLDLITFWEKYILKWKNWYRWGGGGACWQFPPPPLGSANVFCPRNFLWDGNISITYYYSIWFKNFCLVARSGYHGIKSGSPSPSPSSQHGNFHTKFMKSLQFIGSQGLPATKIR